MRYDPVIMIGGNAVLLGLPRRWGVLASVVLVHVAVLWWLQVGLVRDALPTVTPITLISVPMDRPVPVVVPQAPAPTHVPPVSRQQPPPDKLPAPVSSTVSAPPTPLPVMPPTVPSPGVTSPSPGTEVSPTVPATNGRTGAAVSSTPSSVVLPSAAAAYLHNPPPAYPAMSRRLAEQGRVLVRVLIGADGLPQKAELQTGSGYDRLDRAALDAVMRWRFVPGRRGDVPETMWVSVPIVFNLE